MLRLFHRRSPFPERAAKLAWPALIALVAIVTVAGCGGGTEAATATPVSTPEHTPTLVPTPDPLAAKVWDTAVMLAERMSPRESGTEEELRAAEFFSGRFSGWGYEVSLQEFVAVEVTAATRLGVRDREWLWIDESFFPDHWQDGKALIFALPLDPSSRAAEAYSVTGELEYAGLGAEQDMEGVDLTDRIALIEGGGGITLREKVEQAWEAGAAAAVIFNEKQNGGPTWERIYQETSIPAIGVGNREGRELVSMLGKGSNLEVEVLKAPLSPQPSRNVIAQINNDMEDDETLIVGAHYDTTPDSPGANDNGSGVAVAMVVAEELADDDLPFDLRFVLFGSEETGLNGSFAYVGGLGERETDHILAMINLDVVGAGDLTGIVSEGLVDLTLETAREIDMELDIVDLPAGYGADHLPFLIAGIDTIFLFADDVTYINSPLDTLEHLETEPLAQAAEFTLAIIERLAEREG